MAGELATEGTLDAEAIQGFVERVRGAVLLRGDQGYDEALAIWNGLIDRRPALIVQCTGAADVVDAVNFAREKNLLLSVKGGGHNVAGNAVNDGGLVIDLSHMRGVHVDPSTQTGRCAAPAATAASSPPSSSGRIRSARWSWSAPSSTHRTTEGRCFRPGATTWHRRRRS